MKGFAVDGATTTHGGVIRATQQYHSHMGFPLLRAGDGHYCPQCKCWSTIQKSHDHVIFEGQPVAYEDDFLSCGAKIIHQQSHMVGDSQGSFTISFGDLPESNETQKSFTSAQEKKFNLKFQITNNLGQPITNTHYMLNDEQGNTFFGHTDAAGYTEDIFSETEKNFSVHILKNDDEEI